MAKTDGKSNVQGAELDLEHELPAGDANENESTRDSQVARSEPADTSELENLRLERDKLVDRLARMQAEFENARKRSAREQQDYREYAVVESLKALLPILDNFERALNTTNLNAGELRSGVELIYKQLQDAMAKQGLRAIPAKGEPFDPRFHEAIEMVDTADAPDHQVLDELQKGYKFKDRLIRPAMVRVARNTSS